MSTVYVVVHEIPDFSSQIVSTHRTFEGARNRIDKETDGDGRWEDNRTKVFDSAAGFTYWICESEMEE